MTKPDFAIMFTEGLPLCRALNMGVVDLDDGKRAMVLPHNESLVGDLSTGVVHGGAVSVLLDTCCGAEAMMHPDNEIPTVTINLRIDYMRAAKPGQDIFARAEVYHTTKNVAFLRGIAWDLDLERPIATATGTFTFKKREASS